MGGEEMTSHFKSEPFNSPLETGLRSLAILEAAFPNCYDLQRLVEMDYLVVHSADVGGPDSLHAPLPLRAGELLVRRQLIERGLLLMMSKGLIERQASSEGIQYLAGEAASPYLSSLNATYTTQLRERARWLVDTFANFSTEEIRGLIHRFFEHWASDFEPLKVIG
jgi:hypothetical protein